MEIETRVKISSAYDGGVIVQMLSNGKIQKEAILRTDEEAILFVCEHRGIKLADLLKIPKQSNIDLCVNGDIRQRKEGEG